MVYGNIYDPAWREQQLLKELNIPGEEDDENNPDYTADDGENTDGAEGGGQAETEPPAEPDAGGEAIIPDDGAENPDYTTDDDGEDTGEDTGEAGGDGGETLDMAGGEGDGNPDYANDGDTGGEGTSDDPAKDTGDGEAPTDGDTGDGGEGADAQATGGEDPAAGEGGTGDNPDTLDMNADDGGDTGDNPDYTADGGEGDNGGTGEAAPDGGGDAPTGGGDNPDYTADGNDSGGEGDGDNGADTGTDDGDGGTDGGEGGADDFYNLGGDDEGTQAIKNLELKQNYQQMYMSCDDIIKKIDGIAKSNEASEVLRRVVQTCSELKERIEFYLTNTYPTCNYIENAVNFQKYLAILNSIRSVLNDTCEYCKNDTKVEEAVKDLFKVVG